MIWILISALVLIFLLTYGISTFIPHSTNMCVIDLERGVNDSFALANQPENFGKLKKPGTLEFRKGSFSEKGSTGHIQINSETSEFEVTEFIPNYRMAAVHRSESDEWQVQLSFYRLSRNSCRMVLIAKVISSSRWKRIRYALGKTSREQQINQLLAETKQLFESADTIPEHFEDVSAEENPNFSLQ